jgi:hypothetical protein
MEQAVNNARAVAANKQADENYRNYALHVLALEKNSNDAHLLEQLITSGEPETIQQSCITNIQRSFRKRCRYIRHT